MAIFRNFKKEEELKIALEVIESDKRIQAQFNLRKEKEMYKRLASALIATLVVALLIVLLKKPNHNDLDSGEQQKIETQDSLRH